MEQEWKLSPINPFTERQRKVIELILEGRTAGKELAAEFNLSRDYFKQVISGTRASAVLDEIDSPTKSELGIFGIVEEITGTRPADKTQLIIMLAGDVIVHANSHKERK